MTETNKIHSPAKEPRKAPPSTMHLPPLFTQPEVLTPAAHGGLYFTPRDNDEVARRAHALPLIVQEVVVASANVPVLFVKEGEGWGLIALTGLRAGESCSVGKDGRWRGYRPLYLNFYPFIAGMPQDGEAVLCIDRACAGLADVSTPGARALFKEDGRPEDWLIQIQADIAGYRQAAASSASALSSLSALGLLQAATARLQVADAGERVLDGFFVVDRAALGGLPADKLAELRNEGLLEVIYAHLVSLQHLPALAERAAKQAVSQPEKKDSTLRRIDGKKIKQP